MAAKFEIHTRVNNLSFGHHKAIMQAPDNQRDDLFTQAIEEELSTRQLKDLALGKKNSAAIPETKPVIDITDPAMSETTNDDDTTIRSEPPAPYDAGTKPTQAPGSKTPESYDKLFQANKDADYKEANQNWS